MGNEITTPSRFLVLNEINENGELVSKERSEDNIQEKETGEEIVTNEEETINEGENILNGNREDIEVDVNNKESEEVRIAEEVEVAVKSPTYCDILKSPPCSDVEKEAQRKTTKADLANVIRPSLPRNSKTNHRVVNDKFAPGYTGRYVNRKISQ